MMLAVRRVCGKTDRQERAQVFMVDLYGRCANRCGNVTAAAMNMPCKGTRCSRSCSHSDCLQAWVTLSKLVIYCGSSLFLAFIILAVATSDCFRQSQAVLQNQASSLLPDIIVSQGISLSVTLIGCVALVLEVRPTFKTHAILIADPFLL